MRAQVTQLVTLLPISRLSKRNARKSCNCFLVSREVGDRSNFAYRLTACHAAPGAERSEVTPGCHRRSVPGTSAPRTEERGERQPARMSRTARTTFFVGWVPCFGYTRHCRPWCCDGKA